MKKSKKTPSAQTGWRVCVIMAQLVPPNKLAFFDLSCRKIRHQGTPGEGPYSQTRFEWT
jgi:hypothetical protein|tara:strand:- start:457 stop:633 length:177 start_codon:yes stop_codon:yes gene_type:complete